MNVLALSSPLSVWERFQEFSLYHNALAAGLGIALACGLLSVFVVYKRMAFIGEGISHAAFGGAGIALLLGLLAPSLGNAIGRDVVVGVFCVITALAIGRLSRGGRVSEDSAIGICLAAMMALGVILLDVRAQLTTAYTPPFHDLLFGNILGVAGTAFPRLGPQAWASIGLGLVVLTLVLGSFRDLVFFTFDESSAEVFGLRTGVLYYGMLMALGVTIALAMRLLGVILVGALLILPASCASFWTRRIAAITVLSALFAMAGVACGLFLSMWIGVLSTGPVIVLTLFVFFAVSYAQDKARRVRRSRVQWETERPPGGTNDSRQEKDPAC